MKRNILKISAILGLCLVAFVGYSQASETADDDKKKKKKSKTEKRIEVEDENGKTTVTITTIKNGKESVEILTGEDAKSFLKNNSHKGENGSQIEIEIDMSDGGGNAFVHEEGVTSKQVSVTDENGEKVVKVVTVKDGEEIIEEYRGEEADKYLENESKFRGPHSSMFKMDMSDMQNMSHEEIQLKIENMIKEMGHAYAFKFDTESGEGKADVDVKVFTDGVDIPEEVQLMLEKMDINLDQLMEEAEGKKKRRVMVTTMVMVEDVENEKGEAELELEAFELFPNPSEGQLRVQFETGNEKEALVTVNDLNGKEVYRNKVSGATNYELTVDLGAEASGTYIVSVVQNDKRRSKKLILK